MSVIKQHPKRGAFPPSDLQRTVADLARCHGTRGAARLLRLSPAQVLTLSAGLPVLPGTLLQAQEGVRQLESVAHHG